MEGVVGNPDFRARMQKLCVGLAAPCDPPDVETKLIHYFTEKFKGASSLPFAAFMTHDFKWVHGFTDSRSIEQFEKDLDLVEKSPLVPASAADAKRLEQLAGKAQAEADAERWEKVGAIVQSAAKLRGRCEGREALDGLLLDARDWAAAHLDWAEDHLAENGSSKDVRATLERVTKALPGQPESEEAGRGIEAVAALGKLRKLGPKQQAAARAKAAERFAGTRWAALFVE